MFMLRTILRRHRDSTARSGLATAAVRPRRPRATFRLEPLEDRALMAGGAHGAAHAMVHIQRVHGHPPVGAYVQRNLVSDGAITADHTDKDLVNAWGLTSGPNTPFWVANNGTGTSTLYDGAGVAQPSPPRSPLVVTILPPKGGTSPTAPTGAVFNDSPRTRTDFLVNGSPARFLFATEGGTIAAWNSGTTASTVVDRSASHAIYKGLALVNTATESRLYATDFHNNKVDVFNGSFQPVTLPAGAFTDRRLPRGYAPFGIANFGGNLLVTYAQRDRAGTDDVPGRGRGFIDAYNADGQLLGRVASRGALNAPWGLALAPSSFGAASGDLLVGNFGDGRINDFRPTSRGLRFIGQLAGPNRRPLTIDGLWGLKTGTNVNQPNTLFFTAGPNDEKDGLFGSLTPAVG